MEQTSLYVSKFSPASKRAIEICYQLGLTNSIDIVGIDNPTTRERIKHGKLFTIHVVPTLVTEETTGNIKLYQGPKAIQYMQALAVERSLAIQKQKVSKKKKHKSKMLKHLEEEKEEDEYDEIEKLQDEVKTPIPGGGDSSGIVQKGKIQNLNDVMRQMEARRTEELGYDGKKLPYS